MGRYQLSIESDDLAELIAVARAIASAGLPAPMPTATRSTAAPASGPVGQCPDGHGDMRLVPGGTVRAGPRVGQKYPAFYTCDVCQAKQEIPT